MVEEQVQVGSAQVAVDEDHLVTQKRQTDAQIGRQRGLAGAALAAGHGPDDGIRHLAVQHDAVGGSRNRTLRFGLDLWLYCHEARQSWDREEESVGNGTPGAIQVSSARRTRATAISAI